MTQPEVLVTGATRGIGAEISKVLAESGYLVHALARDFDLGRGMAGKSTEHVVDLADPAAISRFIRSFDRQLHAIVHNAGFWRQDPISERNPNDTLGAILQVNVAAPYALTHGLAGRVRERGRIVNISSQLGSTGRAAMGAYSASKHALNGLTRCWALELAGREITVNAVAPGWVDTESNRRDFENEARRRNASATAVRAEIEHELPLRRMIREQEVAALVNFLLSEQASGITGQVYEIK